MPAGGPKCARTSTRLRGATPQYRKAKPRTKSRYSMAPWQDLPPQDTQANQGDTAAAKPGQSRPDAHFNCECIGPELRRHSRIETLGHRVRTCWTPPPPPPGASAFKRRLMDPASAPQCSRPFATWAGRGRKQNCAMRPACDVEGGHWACTTSEGPLYMVSAAREVSTRETSPTSRGGIPVSGAAPWSG